MLGGVYPLYPKARRFLVVLTGIYGLILLLCVPFLLGHALVIGKLIVGFCGLIALSGLLMSIHLLVIGVPPPEGMEPLRRKPRKDDNMLSVQLGDFQLYLVGDEARPMQALLPLGLLLFITCCCAPCSGILVAIAN